MARNYEEMRRIYMSGGIDEAEVAADPAEQFHRWFAEALDSSPGDWFEANAMTLATSDSLGRVAARIVLLKGFEGDSPLFYTSYDSDKGRQLAENPAAAVCFYWSHLERQIRIEGRVEKVDPELSDRYFQSRPRGSQLGALASQQSAVVASRQVLEDRVAELDALYQGQEVPRPESWGGYRLLTHRYEFWQGRPDRVHDRIVYLREDAGGWQRKRLSP
ncbi:pyridoxamine 5'-phosphate oxidase [Candidatus Laterigemmans baculatus]|uniref:pyridoxamine 5'-phosphate oxidase n=1 Tax=Candidatus Laterigemmans baculatus TaxID=2770505 RepID=UPI0013DB95C0|nr:pyridoxamine 5'-phosphate oxidase [Candidatus Laterigemmans baculatus]